MSSLKNNIFYYATKELSQDAFICWLCSFALDDIDQGDEELEKCARNIIGVFLKRGLNREIDSSKIQLQQVDKQIGNIDVLLSVSYENSNYKIIIEDKVNTSEHDDQLSRYRDKVSEAGVSVIGVYYKTGFQSDLSGVENAGYVVFNRKDIISVLETCKSSNDIFLNYKEYWEDYENIVNSYKTTDVETWEWRQVYGFFDELKNELSKDNCWAGYGYVANPSGGLNGLWYGINENRVNKGMFSAAVYLQAEAKWNEELSKYDYRICVKLEDKSKENNKEMFKELIDLVLKREKEYGFEKPNRMGFGVHMTVGIYQVSEWGNTYVSFKNAILESFVKYKELLSCLKNEF